MPENADIFAEVSGAGYFVKPLQKWNLEKMMKIAIIGYGKMGHTVEDVAPLSGNEIVATIDSEEDWKLHRKNLIEADVAIEFSTPGTVVSNILKCFEINLPVVTGTTAWEDQLEMIKQKCLIGGHSLFVASNFSLGVNLFFNLNRYFSKIMNGFSQYDISINETHHTRKLDKPSDG